MNAVSRVDSFRKWTPGSAEMSASHALDVRYRAPDVVLVPLVCAERNGAVLTAARPVRVAIERVDEGYVAENDSLEIFAFGDSAEDALAIFRSQLFDLYEHYSALSDDDVTGDAAGLRTLMLSNFSVTGGAP